MFRYIVFVLSAALIHMTPAIGVLLLAIHTPTDGIAYLVACYVFMILGLYGLFKFHKYIKVN
jgi:hypothetical protein